MPSHARAGAVRRPAPSRSGKMPSIAPERRVVVVDDSEDLRAIFTEMLERDGWDVRPFATAERALDAIASDPPDVVLTDINLGSLSGRGLARAVRADPRTENVILVGVSGSVVPSTGLLRAFDAFHPKPVDVMKLSEMLQAAIDDARREDQDGED